MLQSNLLLFLESKRMEIRENRAKSDESKKSEASSKRKPLLHSSRCEHRRSSMNRTRKESLERVERREIAIALTQSPTIFEQCVYTHALRTPQPRTFTISHPNRERESQLSLTRYISLSPSSPIERSIAYDSVSPSSPSIRNKTVARARDIEIRDREED